MRNNDRYYDSNGYEIRLNDYVKVMTNIGIHKGYIRAFHNDRAKVGCLIGDLWVDLKFVMLIISR